MIITSLSSYLSLFSTLKIASVLCCGNTDIIELSFPKSKIAANVKPSLFVSGSVRIKLALLSISSSVIFIQLWFIFLTLAISLALWIIFVSKKSKFIFGYTLFTKYVFCFLAYILYTSSELSVILISPS